MASMVFQALSYLDDNICNFVKFALCNLWQLEIDLYLFIQILSFLAPIDIFVLKE